MSPMPTVNQTMNPPSTTARIAHQLRTDWQRDWPWVLGLLGFTLFRLWYRLDPHWQENPTQLGEPQWMATVAGFAPLVLAMRVVLADTPACRDLGTHTRPLGHGTLWFSKALFLCLTLVLPAVACDAWLWRGLGHDWGDLAMLLVSSLTNILLLAVLPGGVAGACAETLARLGLLVLVSVVYSIAVFAGVDWLRPMVGVLDAEQPSRANVFMASLPELAEMALLLAAWLLQSLGRRRAPALGLAAMAVIVMSFNLHWRELGWRKTPELPYTGSKLTIETGPGSVNGGASSQSLWNGLRVSGLPADHVASVLLFAPASLKINEPYTTDHRWSDYQNPEGWRAVRYDRSQVLYRHFDAADLWLDRFGEHSGARNSLSRFVSPMPSSEPWRLKLGIHRLRKVLDAPLSEIVAKPPVLVLAPGLQMTFRPSHEDDWNLHIPFDWRKQSSTLALERPGMRAAWLPISSSPNEICMAVLRDGAARQNSRLNTSSAGLPKDRGAPWVEDRANGFDFLIEKPLARMSMAGLKWQDWLKQAHLEVWIAAECGVATFDLSPKQVRQAAVVQ